MIPEHKQAAVARALQEAFGVSEWEEIRPMTAGLSTALVFRVVAQGRAYLLRVITRDDAMNDPTCQFACMKSGAEAGLAPRVWYTSIEERVSITDFVEAQRFGKAEARVLLPAALRRLHALPTFPKVIDYFNFLDRFIERFRSLGILPESETSEVLGHYAELARGYPRGEAELVPSHNDLKPENVLFDGRRVWLVDWEAAFMNDRYFDLAVVANFIVRDEAEAEELLRNYFEEPAGEYRMARFYLMRQVLHMAYAVVFMVFGYSGKAIDPAAPVPDFREFHDAIWSGEISLAGSDRKLEYGRVHWNQFKRNMRREWLEEALRIVAKRHDEEEKKRLHDDAQRDNFQVAGAV